MSDKLNDLVFIKPGTLKLPDLVNIQELEIEKVLKAKFDSLGGNAFAGPVDRKEKTKEGGLAWHLKGGACIIYNSKDKKAFEIHGAIYQKWIALGGVNNYGIPCTDETATPDHVGRYNHFNNHTASIYWTPSTGACAIYGDIRKKWAALGWERSYLGYPTSDEQDFSEDGRANSFQHGGIYCWGDVGTIDLRNVAVRYKGLYCLGTTDGFVNAQNDDYPYVIFGITTLGGVRTIRSRIYDHTKPKQTKIESPAVEIYRGSPYGVNISIVLVEHNRLSSGDPAKVQASVQDGLIAAHKVGVEALKYIPWVGPSLSTLADKNLPRFIPSAANWIASFFSDRKIGAATIPFSGKRLVLLAARTAEMNDKGIGYKVLSSFGSHGGSYQVYLDVVQV
jgi:hypothetical protein